MPVMTLVQKPVEEHNYFETDVNANINIGVPVDGGERLEEDKELIDEDLDNRIRQNREETRKRAEENRRLEDRISQLRNRVGTTDRLNLVV